MKNITMTILLMLFVATPVMADKSQGAGKGKMASEQQGAYQSASKEQEQAQKKVQQEEKQASKEMENKQQMKTEQEQKELGKGSEQGEKSRETKTRKWWKFWE
jgi:hypothetical protein